MSEAVPEHIFQAAKNAAIGSLRAELQDVTNWFGIIRGLSIKAPLSWNLQNENVRSPGQLDVLRVIQDLRYDEVKDLYANALRDANRADGRAIITTVDSDQDLCTFRF